MFRRNLALSIILSQSLQFLLQTCITLRIFLLDSVPCLGSVHFCVTLVRNYALVIGTLAFDGWEHFVHRRGAWVHWRRQL